jgi:transposase-like protein
MSGRRLPSTGLQNLGERPPSRTTTRAREIAATLNTDRRQLDADQRREIVAALREQGHSLRAIAGAVSADAKTVRNDLAGGDLSPPAEVRGQDGKRYPAKRPTIVAALGQREAEKAQHVLTNAEGASPGGVLSHAEPLAGRTPARPCLCIRIRLEALRWPRPAALHGVKGGRPRKGGEDEKTLPVTGPEGFSENGDDQHTSSVTRSDAARAGPLAASRLRGSGGRERQDRAERPCRWGPLRAYTTRIGSTRLGKTASPGPAIAQHGAPPRVVEDRTKRPCRCGGCHT